MSDLPLFISSVMKQRNSSETSYFVLFITLLNEIWKYFCRIGKKIWIIENKSVITIIIIIIDAHA